MADSDVQQTCRKVALVTGSISGMGLACVRLFAKRGVNVVIVDVKDKSFAADLIDEIKRNDGVRADYIQTDLGTSSGIEKLWSEVTKLYPDGIDILVNNAGVNLHVTLTEFPDEEFDRLVAVNLKAPFMLTKRCVPGMIKKGWGRIVNISSVASFVVATPNSTVYCATKSGLNGLTRGVALEYAQHGITCNAVCPGLTNTGMMQEGIKLLAAKTGVSEAEVIAKKLDGFPIKKLITPGQIAELVEFLCLSDAASLMTGATYLIDHGYLAQ